MGYIERGYRMWRRWYKGFLEGAEKLRETWNRKETAGSSARHAKEAEKNQSSKNGQGGRAHDSNISMLLPTLLAGRKCQTG